MNISVFLDDVTAANGPLLFIPGSHKQGVAGQDMTSKPQATHCGRWIERLSPNLLSKVVVLPTGRWKRALVFFTTGPCEPTQYIAVWSDDCVSFALRN